MYLENKKVFLAGSTGLVGTSILQELLRHFPTVTIRAAYHAHTKPFIKNERIEYVAADLRSLEEAGRACAGCDCAIMAAAFTAGARMFAQEPWKLVNDNVIMNVQMLEAFRKEKVKRVVYISSATLYQEFDGFIREDQLDLNLEPFATQRGIGWVARFCEKICTFMHHETGIETLVARAANIYGPYANFDPQYSNFIPALIRKAVDRMDPFQVWGSPDVKRDVLYAEDFARAITLMLDAKQITCDVFNIGSGSAVSVQEVVSCVLNAAGHVPSRILYDDSKPSTVKFRALDYSKAQDLLGWQPRISLSEGIRRTTQWWIENKEWWNK
ncbi:MAG: NAD(P)-dependent oxidoreductase [Candidatus Omnitrophica bacterium]|nr:NAD(P)-dependent oxidoreductase [Candidatus Omnitrophota bacterium]